MIYLGIVEQRANELLSSYINLQQHGSTYASLPPAESNGLAHSASAPPSGLLVGPNTPANLPPPSITVPTTAEDFESDDSEEVHTPAPPPLDVPGACLVLAWSLPGTLSGALSGDYLALAWCLPGDYLVLCLVLAWSLPGACLVLAWSLPGPCRAHWSCL